MKKHLLLILLLVMSSICVAQAPNAPEVPTTSENKSIIQEVETWYAQNMNHFTIAALMTVESSFIPFPSEIVIPPAVFVASNPDSSLNVSDSYFVNVSLIVLFGTIGALLGAIINYFLAMWLGRPIIYRFADSKLGRLCLLSSEKIQHAENYFNKHGKVSTFIGRLIPGVRQLISVPAGLAKMNFLHFILYTTIGAGIWNAVLALLGYVAHGQADLINEYSHELSIIVMAIFLLAVGCVMLRKFVFKKKK